MLGLRSGGALGGAVTTPGLRSAGFGGGVTASGLRSRAAIVGAVATGLEVSGADDLEDGVDWLAQQFDYEGLRFNPPREWGERTAPTELDLWRGRLLQGEGGVNCRVRRRSLCLLRLPGSNQSADG